MPRKKIGGRDCVDAREIDAASAGVKTRASKRRTAARAGRTAVVTPNGNVGAPNCDGHVSNAPQGSVAIAGDDLVTSVNPTNSVIATIRAQWRQRQAWHRAEKSLTLQTKALCRALTAGDLKEADKLYGAVVGKGEHPMADIGTAATFPLIQARDSIEIHRNAIEKLLAKEAKQLAAAEWVDSVKGFGIGSFAAIVGEAGDLANYSNPAKLWKRMGLAVMPNGERQRKFSDPVMAIAAGYNPSRRSVVWNIGDCLIKANSPQYRPIYDQRKEYELTRTDRPIVAHARAKRYMEKRLLLNLWKAWRAASGCSVPTVAVPPAIKLATE